MASPKAHIHVPVDRDLHTRSLRVIPHGCRTAMFEKVLEIIVDALEKPGIGLVMVGAILRGNISLKYTDEEMNGETRTRVQGSTDDGS